MKTKTMKITGILITLVMFVTILNAFSLTAFAADENQVVARFQYNSESTYTEYTNLSDALQALNSADSKYVTFTLMDDVQWTEDTNLRINSPATLIIFKLNGFTLDLGSKSLEALGSSEIQLTGAGTITSSASATVIAENSERTTLCNSVHIENTNPAGFAVRADQTVRLMGAEMTAARAMISYNGGKTDHFFALGASYSFHNATTETVNVSSICFDTYRYNFSFYSDATASTTITTCEADGVFWTIKPCEHSNVSESNGVYICGDCNEQMLVKLSNEEGGNVKYYDTFTSAAASADWSTISRPVLTLLGDVPAKSGLGIAKSSGDYIFDMNGKTVYEQLTFNQGTFTIRGGGTFAQDISVANKGTVILDGKPTINGWTNEFRDDTDHLSFLSAGYFDLSNAPGEYTVYSWVDITVDDNLILPSEYGLFDKAGNEITGISAYSFGYIKKTKLAAAIDRLDELLKVDGEDATGIIVDIQEELETITDLIGELGDNVTVASEIERLGALIESLTKRVEANEGNITTNKDEIKKLQETLDGLSEALEKIGSDSLADALIDLDAAISKLNGALGALTGRVSQNESDIDDLQEAVEKLTEADKKLSEAISDNTDDIAELTTELADKYQTLVDLIGKLPENTDSMKDYVDDINEVLAKADETLQASIEQLKADLENADGKLESAINTNASNIADLTTDLTNKYNTLKELVGTLPEGVSMKEFVDNINKALDETDGTLQTAINKVASDLAALEKELADATAAGDSTLDGKITALSEALASVQATLEATDAANRAALEAQIESAKSSLQSSVSAVRRKLDSAVSELQAAIASGDTALGDQISALNTALEQAVSAYEAADEALKSELTAKIDAAVATLDAAVKAVQKNLDEAKTALNQAIADGDAALDGKITALDEALASAKAALEAASAESKSELAAKIDEADAAIKQVQQNLDDVKAELDGEIARLNTTLTVVAVVAGIGVCGNVALLVWIIVDKRKKTIV